MPNRDPWIVAGVELGGVRTVLMVPMLKDNELIGAFSVYRQEVRPFTEKQIALVQNFAAQAVIAIENARLLNELRGSRLPTRSLSSRQRHPKCFKLSSSSPGDLEPVFATMLEKAVRSATLSLETFIGGTAKLCTCSPGIIQCPPAFAEWRRAAFVVPYRPENSSRSHDRDRKRWSM